MMTTLRLRYRIPVAVRLRWKFAGLLLWLARMSLKLGGRISALGVHFKNGADHQHALIRKRVGDPT